MITGISSIGIRLSILTFLSSTSAFLPPIYKGDFARPCVHRLTDTKQKDVIHNKFRPCAKPLRNRVELQMGNENLDMVTYLRTEWVSASLCTNQIPKTSKSVLQIGTDDGRAVNFVPKTVEELITSSVEEDGIISMSCRRQMKQQKERRGTSIKLTYVDQAADDLKELKNESVDAVISFQAADRMRESGMDWKKSLKEVARVLKPGGRFLFVEKSKIEGDSYVEEVMSVKYVQNKNDKSTDSDEVEDVNPTFEMVGYDEVDYVLVSHVAGVVEKAMYSGMTASAIEAQKAVESKARMAELSIDAFERGLKRRKKKKKKKKSKNTEDEET